MIFVGLNPFWGTVNIVNPDHYISYIPIFEKILGYCYAPFFVSIFLSGKLLRVNVEK
ncbi:MAG: hypothetical protein K0S80_5106 [Neobacillus sp.]|nr:hypothetical protein [Neobacillus sp.]